MKYCNELKHKLSVLCSYIDTIESNTENITLIDKDIILEKIRSIYEYVHDIPVNFTEPSYNTPANDSTHKTSVSSQEHTDIDCSHTILTSAPIFAPEEKRDETEVVAEPVMQEVEDENYDDLFDDDSQPGTMPELNNSTRPEQEETKPLNEHIQQNEGQSNKPTPETSVPESDHNIVSPSLTEENKSKQHQTTQNQEQTATDKITDNPQTLKTEPSLFDYLSKNAERKPTNTIGEKFGQDHSNIGDHISQQVATHKVADLRTVININDKFSFVGALFHNNMRAYTDFILRLNAIETREEATNYISETAQQYNWNMDSLEVKTFNKILDRKF